MKKLWFIFCKDELVLEKLRLGDKDFFTEQYIPWLNKWEEFNFVIADLYSPSIDMDVYATSEEYDTFRENIINENKEKIENGDFRFDSNDDTYCGYCEIGFMCNKSLLSKGKIDG